MVECELIGGSSSESEARPRTLLPELQMPTGADRQACVADANVWGLCGDAWPGPDPGPSQVAEVLTFDCSLSITTATRS